MVLVLRNSFHFFFQIKIIDFGCATEFDPEKKYQSFSGTPEFFPPEVFKVIIKYSRTCSKSKIFRKRTILENQ